jgi:hypothetical protein
MLKPKSSQSSGCTHIHQTSRESVNKRLPARKLMAAVFCNRKASADGGISATTITSEVFCKKKKKKKKLCKAIQNKRWNAEIRYTHSAPP